MTLSIIIPVYNEEKTITQVLQKVANVKLHCKKELIIVDDGSTDGTPEQIKAFLNKSSRNCRYIRHKRNIGKGSAIKSGIENATGDFVLIQDADLEYDPNEIEKLISPVMMSWTKTGPKKIAVYGTRFANRNIEISPLYLLGNKFLTFITNILFGIKLTDMETGYKLLPLTFLRKVTFSSHHFEIEPEITAKLVKNNYSIIEVPISYRSRTHLAGKKITALDAYEAVKTLIYHRFHR